MTYVVVLVTILQSGLAVTPNQSLRPAAISGTGSGRCAFLMDKIAGGGRPDTTRPRRDTVTRIGPELGYIHLGAGLSAGFPWGAFTPLVNDTTADRTCPVYSFNVRAGIRDVFQFEWNLADASFGKTHERWQWNGIWVGGGFTSYGDLYPRSEFLVKFNPVCLFDKQGSGAVFVGYGLAPSVRYVVQTTANPNFSEVRGRQEVVTLEAAGLWRYIDFSIEIRYRHVSFLTGLLRSGDVISWRRTGSIVSFGLQVGAGIGY